MIQIKRIVHIMKLTQTILFFLILASNLCYSQGTYLWNGNRLKEIKSNPSHYSGVISQCKVRGERYLSSLPITIVDKPLRYVLNPHNYASLSKYYWPDPNNPSGKYLLRDGERNPEYKEYDGGKLEDMEYRLRCLSIAYYMTESSSFREAYLRQLRAWFIDRSTYMYPNFEYAQIAPGHDNNNGRPWGIIEAYNFNNIIESFRLVNTVSPIDSNTTRKLKRWFKQFISWLENSDKGKTVLNSDSNQGIALDVLLLNMKLFVTGKIDSKLLNNFRSNRLERQILTDGSQPEELKRSRALNYSAYNLEHIVDFCVIMEKAGIPYYRNNKDIIDKAFSFLFNYIENPTLFPYKENSWEEGVERLLLAYNRLPGIIISDQSKLYDFYSSAGRIYQ